jgi:hypothetical protein
MIVLAHYICRKLTSDCGIIIHHANTILDWLKRQLLQLCVHSRSVMVSFLQTNYLRQLLNIVFTWFFFSYPQLWHVNMVIKRMLYCIVLSNDMV